MENAVPMPPEVEPKKQYIRILIPRKTMVCDMVSAVVQPIGVYLHWEGRGILCTQSVDGVSFCAGCKRGSTRFWYAAICGRDWVDNQKAVLMVPQASWVEFVRHTNINDSLYGLRLHLKRLYPDRPSSPCALSVQNGYIVPRSIPKKLTKEQAQERVLEAYERFVIQP